MTAPSIREAVARAIKDWIRDQAPLTVKMRLEPAHVDQIADAAVTRALPIIREHYAGVADPVTPPGSTDYDKQAYDIRRNVAAAIRADEGPK